MKLGIGTAQFGSNYGVSNLSGKASFEDVCQVLRLAAEKGIQVVDTAAAYGSSEEVLGSALPSGHSFRIVTKLRSLRPACMEGALAESLHRLRQQKIYGVLFHDAGELLGPGGESLWRELEALKGARLVEKIGVSVYDGSQIDNILQRFAIDLVQLPISLLDQRLLRSGHLDLLKRHNVEIHARSAFLQGLLLMHPDSLPPFFSPIREELRSLHDFLAKQGITPLRAALSFVASLAEVDAVIVGVVRAAELSEVCEAACNPVACERLKEFALSDPTFLNPSRWAM